jgi:DNA-binding PadR family transcriptional regulator
MSRRRVSNPLALAVLSCLHERPMHPYEISTTLRTRGKEQSIKLNYGSITTRETTREGRRPERTVYQITPAGRDEFEDWLSELLSTPVRDYHSLEAGLSLMAGLPPDAVAAMLDQRVLALRRELAALDEGGRVGAEMGLPEVFWVESSFRHTMLSAELGFVVDLVARIRSGEFGGTAVWRTLHELRAAGISFETILADPVGHLGEEARILTQTPQPPG